MARGETVPADPAGGCCGPPARTFPPVAPTATARNAKHTDTRLIDEPPTRNDRCESGWNCSDRSRGGTSDEPTTPVWSKCLHGGRRPQVSIAFPAMIYRSPFPDVETPILPITDYVFERLDRYADKPAIIDGATGATLRYRELLDRVRR